MVVLSVTAFDPGCLAAQSNAVSGRAVGEMTPSFPVLNVTGPHKGKLVCYVCESKGAPVVFAFFRQTGDETASLVKKLNELAQKQDLRVVAVIMEGQDSQPWLKKFADENGITMHLTILRNGKDDVAVNLYKLNRTVSNTILVSAKHKVTANLVNVNAQNFGTLTDAVSRVLSQK
jgi:peroxiredoxin